MVFMALILSQITYALSAWEWQPNQERLDAILKWTKSLVLRQKLYHSQIT